jgi:hypothetical protein
MYSNIARMILGKRLAYFFFDFNDKQKQDPEMIVRSLLCQLSQQSIKIPISLNALFSSCESGKRQPLNNALIDALQSMIRDLPQSYVVLDALDECTQRAELIDVRNDSRIESTEPTPPSNEPKRARYRELTRGLCRPAEQHLSAK